MALYSAYKCSAGVAVRRLRPQLCPPRCESRRISFADMARGRFRGPQKREKRFPSSLRRQRDRVAVFCVGKSPAPLVEKDVRRLAGPLWKEDSEEVNFELRLAEPGPERRCGVPRCANAGGMRAP